MNRGGAVVTIWLASLLAGSDPGQAADPARRHFPDTVTVHIAYTASLFRSIAENDAEAAVKVWVAATAREMSLPVTSEVDLVPDGRALARRLESGQSDLGTTTVFEYLEMEGKLAPQTIFLTDRGGVSNVQYQLLVRRDSAIQNLSDLRGADLKLLDTFETSLALPWLEVLLAEQRLGGAEGFLGRIEPASKLSAVVLPVFFGQSKACVVTRSGFETMTELNPQLGRDLRVLAQSSGLATTVMFFRRDFQPAYLDEMIHAMLGMHRSPSGRQILMLAQGDALVLAPPAALDSARNLVRNWHQVKRKPGARSAALPKVTLTSRQAGE